MLRNFDESNIPFLVERLLPLWGIKGESEDFNRLYVKMIILSNMHENQMQFEITDEGNVKAIAFLARKGDFCNYSRIEEIYKKFDDDKKIYFRNGKDFLSKMEEKTFSLLGENDVKLCLFVSIEKGWGHRILEEVFALLKSKGIANVYLWTDCECNVQWYFDHDYFLVSEEEYPPFSRNGKKYMTYIFKKCL